MKLTGRDIHTAYRRVRPHSARSFRSISKASKRLYRELARELNHMLTEDTVTIIAVRCSTCGQMLQCEHCEGHACWLDKEKS